MELKSLFNVGDRVRVVKNETDEPELVGMWGRVARVGSSSVVVFLDGDAMPTHFNPDELEQA